MGKSSFLIPVPLSCSQEIGIQLSGQRTRIFIPDQDLNLEQLEPATAHRDGDLSAAGVEAVLEQLLEGVGRPLDHLAGSDTVHHDLDSKVVLAAEG